MSKDRGIYKMPDRCSQCDSNDLYAEAMIGDNGNIYFRYICGDCGKKSSLLPKIENLKARTSGPLAKWAASVLYRDNYKCVICGDVAKDAHHIIPVRNATEEEKFNINNGISLCRKCHRSVHYGEYHGGRA